MRGARAPASQTFARCEFELGLARSLDEGFHLLTPDLLR